MSILWISSNKEDTSFLDNETNIEQISELSSLETGKKYTHVITNSYRFCDGGESTIMNTIGAIRLYYRNVPIMIFHHSNQKAVNYISLENMVFETTDQSDLIKFLNTNFIPYSQFYGAFIGLIVGDALGTTYEFSDRDTVRKEIADDGFSMKGKGPFNVPKGGFTDDSAMALCIAHSLVMDDGFDPNHIMDLFIEWKDQGFMNSHLTHHGRCVDIGNATKDALCEYQANRENPFCGHEISEANGSLMRLIPIILFFSSNRIEIVADMACLSSRLTHPSKHSKYACYIFAQMVYKALHGESKEDLCRDLTYPSDTPQDLRDTFSRDYSEITLDNANSEYGSGHVSMTLSAVLCAFYNTTTFKEGMQYVISFGKDTDTIGAIYGQLAGAYYGKYKIPEYWINTIKKKPIGSPKDCSDYISYLIDNLYLLSHKIDYYNQ